MIYILFTILSFINAVIPVGLSFTNINYMGKRQDYTDSRSAIYNPNTGKAYILGGGIAYTYWTNGGCAEFGLPSGDEGRIDNNHGKGWYQHFEKANIYWHETNRKVQPGIVRGSIRNYFESRGGVRDSNPMGWPEGSEWGSTSYTCNSNGISGTMQHFTNGKVYLSKIATVFVPWSDWNWINHYENVEGGVSSMGWPRTSKVNENGVERIYFEKGYLEGRWTLFIHWWLGKVRTMCEIPPGYDYKRFTTSNQILQYITNEMINNSKSELVHNLQSIFTRIDSFIFNLALLPLSILFNPLTLAVVLNGHDITGLVKELKEAMLKFIEKIGAGKDWDHKPKIASMFYSDKKAGDYWSQVFPDIEYEYFYDIWSNIHFGYISKAAGMPEWLIQEGAHAGQYAKNTQDFLAQIIPQIGEVYNPIYEKIGSNNQSDRISTQIGIELWKKYGNNVTPENVREVLMQFRGEYVREYEASDRGRNRFVSIKEIIN